LCWVFLGCLLGLILNQDPPDLCLLSN
jgi:hypothetical protein